MVFSVMSSEMAQLVLRKAFMILYIIECVYIITYNIYIIYIYIYMYMYV